MSYWFGPNDSVQDCLRHIDDDHCPQSIREDAERELKERGYSDEYVTAARLGKLDHLGRLNLDD